ncbi:MAG: insulinase family protein, partial [Halioglobus sp.]|nr:insulinase family protein [Halioglobus sp.]
MIRFNPRQGLQCLPCVLLFILVAACATTPDPDPQPVQSPNDDYRYRLLTLDNAMQVLLISDVGAPKAAAALDVYVGSADNPPGRAGLAHFLEHMLFLGTDKYPDAAEYERFITEHGGSHNAYTSFENTNYFFDVNAEDLPEALDRFAQFFIAPRFDAGYVDREKNAVQAEYQMGLKSDERRGLDVLQEVMNPEHPFSQFTVGSLETLADRPDGAVRDDMMAFYDRHYSANVMRLVVLGAQSLDELERLVRPLFSQVPNRHYTREQIEEPLLLPDQMPLYVALQPLATQRQLSISFPIPDYQDQYRTKPALYLGNLIGHEGEGSLLSQLKAEGLAEALSAGSGLGWAGGALFSVMVSLTDKGSQQPQRVLQLLFAYVDMLRREGPQDWLYAEQSKLAALSFRFREQVSPVGYVSALASGMQYYEPEDILRGPYMMDQYDEAVLAELLQQIRPGNALVVISKPSVTGDEVSQFYEVPFSRQPLDVDGLATEVDDVGVAAMQLPSTNEFIAADVSLVALPEAMPSVPAVALETDRQTIWYMPDDQFRVPRGVTYIKFRSPNAGQSAQQSARLALYTALLTDHVNEFAYPARLAGMNFSFGKHALGITLRMGGYTDQQPLLLRRLLEMIKTSRFSPNRFEDIRSDMIRKLQNTAAKRPSSQVVGDLNEALQYSVWGEPALIAALQATDLESLQDYIAVFWRDATAEALLFGNYPPAEVEQLAQALDDVLSKGVAPTLPEIRILKLAAGESLQYRVDVSHDDTVVAWYLQGAGDDWKDRAMAALTAQIMSSGFFQQLRTEQQLGYIVGVYSYPKWEVPGILMLVQSPVADATVVAESMQAFMQGLVASLDEAQFERHKVSLISDILRPDKNLAERAEFYWQSIARKQPAFDGRETFAAAVDALTLQSGTEAFNTVFMDRRHALQVVA